MDDFAPTAAFINQALVTAVTAAVAAGADIFRLACSNCNGTGILTWTNAYNGVCFACNGTGVVECSTEEARADIERTELENAHRGCREIVSMFRMRMKPGITAPWHMLSDYSREMACDAADELYKLPSAVVREALKTLHTETDDHGRYCIRTLCDAGKRIARVR